MPPARKKSVKLPSVTSLCVFGADYCSFLDGSTLECANDGLAFLFRSDFFGDDSKCLLTSDFLPGLDTS